MSGFDDLIVDYIPKLFPLTSEVDKELCLSLLCSLLSFLL